MKRNRLFVIAAVFVAVFAVSVPQAAMAGGTAPNTSVDNTVVVDWNAGAVANSTTDTASFVVDRLVTFTVTNNTAAGLTVGVFPGVVGAEPDVNVLSYSVYNASNTTLDFALSALNSGDPVTSNISIYADNGDRIFDTATDVIAASLDNVPMDTAFYVFVVGDISSGAAPPEVENVDLLAEALDYATATSLLSDSGTAWQAGTLQNVLFDAVGTAAGDGANDGSHSDRGFYEVVSPSITVTKTITGVADARAFNNTNPKAIPGATVSYRLVVENTGTGDATGVILTDNLSAVVNTTDVSSITPSVGGTSLNDTNPDTIIWTVGTVAPASSVNLTYDVIIP